MNIALMEFHVGLIGTRPASLTRLYWPSSRDIDFIPHRRTFKIHANIAYTIGPLLSGLRFSGSSCCESTERATHLLHHLSSKSSNLKKGMHHYRLPIIKLL